MAFEIAPAYTVSLQKADKTTWALRTMQDCQALLVTSNGMGQMTLSFADPDDYIRQHVQARAMNTVQLSLLSPRTGTILPAWTGYVDAVHRAFDTQQGNMTTFACTSTQKLFEITRQTPADVGGLGKAYLNNIRATDVLRYAAHACGFPASMLAVHPVADSGSGIVQYNASQLWDPDQQPWTAILSGLQANSGIEHFFDEHGYCYWRQLDFVAPWSSDGRHAIPTPIPAGDIIQADFVESDQGVVTRIEVRFPQEGGGTGSHAGYWAAPISMETHLRSRILAIYAPWIYNKDAADYLARTLGEQYSAGVLSANVTVPADPSIRIGSLVQVPDLGRGGLTLYYVQSITYQLHWGASWVMTLGLAYGHAPGNSFPYIGTVTFPVPSAAALVNGPKPGTITPNGQASDPENTAWITTPFALQMDKTVPTGKVATSEFTPGSVIWLYTDARSKGRLIGEFRVIAPAKNATIPGVIAGNFSAKDYAVTAYVTKINSPQNAYINTATGAGLSDFPGTKTYAPGTGDIPLGSMIIPVAGETYANNTQPWGSTTNAAEPAYFGYTHFHLGIDFPAPLGTPLHSCASGVVTGAGWDTTGFGNMITVAHGNTSVFYGHCDSFVSRIGDTVQQGQVIAYVGSTGNSSGPHVHLGMTAGGQYAYVDPTPYLASS